MIASGRSDELVAAHAEPVVELTFEGEVPAGALNGSAIVDGSRVRIPTSDPATTLATILPRLPAGSLGSVEIMRPDLEAVYLGITGRRYEEADQDIEEKEVDHVAAS